MKAEILIVDDEPAVRQAIAAILGDEGYSVRQAAEGQAALAEIEARAPGVVLLDIWLEGSKLDGLEVLDHIRQTRPEVPVIVISGHGTIETAVNAIKKGAYDFLEKPFNADRLLVLIERAREATRLKRENAELKLKLGDDRELIGRSTAIQQVRNAIQRVALTGSRVLITGPPGVGKEVVARLIHASSRRAEAPFVVINAATMAPERMEVELFGCEAGFLGPERPRQLGTFERAHGGTLLLDEVADMPLETQGKILRVLQEQSFTAARRPAADPGRRPGDRREQPRPAGRDRRRPLPRGPVLPPERRADPGAAALGAARRHPDADRVLHGARRRGVRPAGPQAVGRRAGPAPVGRLAGQRPPAAQRARMAADHGAGRCPQPRSASTACRPS